MATFVMMAGSSRLEYRVVSLTVSLIVGQIVNLIINPIIGLIIGWKPQHA